MSLECLRRRLNGGDRSHVFSSTPRKSICESLNKSEPPPLLRHLEWQANRVPQPTFDASRVLTVISLTHPNGASKTNALIHFNPCPCPFGERVSPGRHRAAKPS